MSLNWQQAEFKIGAQIIDQIPSTNFSEVCFAGRSNVGKSSLINVLCGRNSLSRTSKNPGCTQQLNFFLIGEKMFLVDMPGYGYAKKSKKTRNEWDKLIRKYLLGRPLLKRVFLLIDSRRGFKESDIEIMKLMDETAVVYQVIFTKIDEINQVEKQKIEQEFQKLQKYHPAKHPNFILSSSKNNIGIDEIKNEILSLV